MSCPCFNQLALCESNGLSDLNPSFQEITSVLSWFIDDYHEHLLSLYIWSKLHSWIGHWDNLNELVLNVLCIKMLCIAFLLDKFLRECHGRSIAFLSNWSKKFQMCHPDPGTWFTPWLGLQPWKLRTDFPRFYPGLVSNLPG